MTCIIKYQIIDTDDVFSEFVDFRNRLFIY